MQVTMDKDELDKYISKKLVKYCKSEIKDELENCIISIINSKMYYGFSQPTKLIINQKLKHHKLINNLNIKDNIYYFDDKNEYLDVSYEHFDGILKVE